VIPDKKWDWEMDLSTADSFQGSKWWEACVEGAFWGEKHE
jgi:hypothetical protein